ncbi:MFS transporter [Microbacterium sp. ASV49]|uniref:MFS transporter n=1 Tax=Microbacterium candidum TaxID=3041922 RepID=A0ABT7N0K9_9MICO|nr:MFS transporter [Microbacterium sp. ASV49]MDL9980191.1 MFS transporter [Microbacterium sp. ASV49]
MTVQEARAAGKGIAAAALRPFASLQEPGGFRALFVSNIAFFTGAWSITFVLGWMVYEQTHSEVDLAVFTSVRLAPLLLGPLAGVLSDRFERRRLLLVASAWSLVATAAIAALATAGNPAYPALLAAGLAIGIAQSPSQPARAALAAELVEPALLSNANALNSLVFSSTMMLGPAVGGVLVSAFGAPAALWVTAAWYAASFISMQRVPADRPRVTEHHDGAWRMLADGARDILRIRVVSAVLAITILANTLVFSISSGFMPVFARDVLSLDAAGLGALMTCWGVGGTAGSLIVAGLGDFQRKGAVFLGGTALMGLMFALFGLTTAPWLAFLLLTCTGLVSSTFGVLQTTLILSATPPQLQGRAMGLQELAIGAMPLAALLVGATAHVVGIGLTTFLFGMLLAVLLVVIAVTVPALLRYDGVAADRASHA